MYWVLTKAQERTIAITQEQEVAAMVAANYKEKCVVRYTDEKE